MSSNKDLFQEHPKVEKMEHTSFNPNGIGLNNGQFIGLPFDEENAEVVLFSVPWDVTASFRPGTSVGPMNMLKASSQLDLSDYDLKQIWGRGIYLRIPDMSWWSLNNHLRFKARRYINFLEDGGLISESPMMQNILAEINEKCLELKNWVRKETSLLLKQGKQVGLVGGDHSVALGYLEALAERHEHFSILQIDAHMDLRVAYEGFIYSHASFAHNALQIPNVKHISLVGIRDWCEAEETEVLNNPRISVFYDQEIKEAHYEGISFYESCSKIVNTLTDKVYISFDIDGLDPKLCPNTGTPVPGGLEFQEAFYLIKKVVQSGRQIIGFDLCEVAGEGAWDGNVGARVLYKLAGWLGRN